MELLEFSNSILNSLVRSIPTCCINSYNPCCIFSQKQVLFWEKIRFFMKPQFPKKSLILGNFALNSIKGHKTLIYNGLAIKKKLL